MILPNHNPKTLKNWSRLEQHFQSIRNLSIKDHFAANAQHSKVFQWHWKDFFIDLSKNRWNEETLSILLELAKEAELPKAIDSYFNGSAINQTENFFINHNECEARIF